MTDTDLRSLTPLSRSAALLPTTAAVVLAALAFAAVGHAGPTTSIASAAPSNRQPAGEPSGPAQVVLRLSDGSATATLEDTSATRQFVALLPLELTLRDPMGQAKSGRLPTALAVADAEKVTDPEVAGLYYWPPSGDIAIVYDDLGQSVPPPGLVRLGTVTTGLTTIASGGNRFSVSVSRL